MLSLLRRATQLGPGLALQFGIKNIKYFIDSTLRAKVTPVPGSVLYCDLWVAVEHSGIYAGDGKIVNIVVEGLAESTVRLDRADGFTSKSVLGRQIYVSCDADGAVGDTAVAAAAHGALGQRGFYGLVYKNCHHFSTRCVQRAPQSRPLAGALARLTQWDTWEPSITALKHAAADKLGATKWRLWDWQAEYEDDAEPMPAPDWDASARYFQQLPLSPENVAMIQAQLDATVAYAEEIADEDIPAAVRQRLLSFRQALGAITAKYAEARAFIDACGSAAFSYEDLTATQEDYSALAPLLQQHAGIRALVRQLGRNYIDSEKKRQRTVTAAGSSEVHGTRRSDDLMRILPSELVNLEDDTLELLFYAHLLEHNLMSYALKGTNADDSTASNQQAQRTGPVVALLDTSGSMQGEPMLKAKALLLTCATRLASEGRSLHVLLFGDAGQLREYRLESAAGTSGLLAFLAQGFGGGTDFTAPLRRAVDIIDHHPQFLKADVLLISDGDCQVDESFETSLKEHKERLGFAIYSVLCNGARATEHYSDEVIVL